MLRFLLDEHISPAVTEQIHSLRPEITIWSLQAWEGGNYLSAADDRLLTKANGQGLTLVTYDQRTIVPLLRAWSEAGHPHGGVVFVNCGNLSSRDIDGLVRSLILLWDTEGQYDWTDRVVYQQRSTPKT